MAAGAEVFVEKGFYGAAIDDITERAGYTKGAFYSNFDDKAALFLAVLAERTQAQIDEVREILVTASSPTEMMRRLRARDGTRPEDPAWLMLMTEFWLYAMRHPDVRPRLAERERVMGEAYTHAVAMQFEKVGVSPPAPIELLALIVQILDQGAATRRHLDPDAIPENFFYEAITLLTDATVALAHARAATVSA